VPSQNLSMLCSLATDRFLSELLLEWHVRDILVSLDFPILSSWTDGLRSSSSLQVMLKPSAHTARIPPFCCPSRTNMKGIHMRCPTVTV